MNKFAVFIDRDGTINEEVGYVDSFDRFHILPGVSDAIRKLNENKIPAIVITNQSGIGRGYFSFDSFYYRTWRYSNSPQSVLPDSFIFGNNC